MREIEWEALPPDLQELVDKIVAGAEATQLSDENGEVWAVVHPILSENCVDTAQLTCP